MSHVITPDVRMIFVCLFEENTYVKKISCKNKKYIDYTVHNTSNTLVTLNRVTRIFFFHFQRQLFYSMQHRFTYKLFNLDLVWTCSGRIFRHILFQLSHLNETTTVHNSGVTDSGIVDRWRCRWSPSVHCIVIGGERVASTKPEQCTRTVLRVAVDVVFFRIVSFVPYILLPSCHTYVTYIMCIQYTFSRSEAFV